MNHQHLNIHIDQRGVATVTMRRPEVHNAFDDVLVAELTQCFTELPNNSKVRAVVLAGAGKSFSAGADMNWMRSMAGYSREENHADSLKLAQMLRALDECPLPTIASVQGAAFGGGVGLVAACDMAIASPEAVFGLTEVRLGLVPAVISPYVIAAIGPRQARRFFLTGERFDSDTAQRIGLVHEVAADLESQVEVFLKHLLACGPQAMTAAKALVHDMTEGDLIQRDARDDRTSELIARLRVSDEGQEGLNAFLDKRKPAWSAR